MCVKEVRGTRKDTWVDTAMSKIRKNSAYPDCDEYGVVTRGEVQLWTNNF